MSIPIFAPSRLVQRPPAPLPLAAAALLAYGWSVAADGSYSHSGSDGTSAFVDPSRGLVVLVFTQTPRGRNPVSRFRELVKLALEG